MASANVINSNTLAKFFRKDIRTIQLWAKKGMPREGRDKFDFIQCSDWRIKELEKENDELRGTDGILKSSKERKEHLNAEILEYELALLKKELIRTDEAASFLERLITVVKTKLPTSRKTLIPKLLIAKDDKAVLKILEQRDNDLLNEFSNTIENIISGLAQSSDKNYTAAGPDKAKERRKS